MKKNERGSVTALTMATVLTILLILGTYMANVYVKRKAQLQETKLLQEIYDGDMSQIYQEQLAKKSVKNDYTDVLYIEATGTQYINTGVVANQNTSVKMTVEFTDLNISQTLYCSRSGMSSNTYTLFLVNNNFRYDYNSTQNDVTAGLVINKKYNIYANKNTLKLNDNTIKTVTAATFTSGGTMYLMASYQTPYQTIDNFSKYKLYSTEIYDGNTLVRNLVPCYRNSDKKAGLYDTVNDKFYTNIGNGEFKIGPEI